MTVQFGKAEDQAMEGCEQIKGIPELSQGVSRYRRRGGIGLIQYSSTGSAFHKVDYSFARTLNSATVHLSAIS